MQQAGFLQVAPPAHYPCGTLIEDMAQHFGGAGNLPQEIDNWTINTLDISYATGDKKLFAGLCRRFSYRGCVPANRRYPGHGKNQWRIPEKL